MLASILVPEAEMAGCLRGRGVVFTGGCKEGEFEGEARNEEQRKAK